MPHGAQVGTTGPAGVGGKALRDQTIKCRHPLESRLSHCGPGPPRTRGLGGGTGDGTQISHSWTEAHARGVGGGSGNTLPWAGWGWAVVCGLRPWEETLAPPHTSSAPPNPIPVRNEKAKFTEEETAVKTEAE